MQEYCIKSGDNFHKLAQQLGCCWQDFTAANPGIDPCTLQVGQIIMLPPEAAKTQSVGCADLLGQGIDGRCDDVIVEVEGVKFRVTRIGEPTTPHELHLILPRTEIHKVEHPMNGLVETSIMISNINIVNSPRFEGEGGDKAEQSQGLSQKQIESFGQIQQSQGQFSQNFDQDSNQNYSVSFGQNYNQNY
ncbi:MAG: LysM peptidoglycan-binding domain-containing protein [Peptococcaceae bacterium]|nr:LysM peptidoglycan-binding domain-containing protein [Peptococcaceae bacterium]